MTNEISPKRVFIIDGYTIKELAELYSQTPYIIEQWLVPHQELIGVKTGRFYTPKQVATIIECIGLPKGYVLNS